VIKNKKTGEYDTTRGQSSAPHPYLTKGKAEGRRKSFGVISSEMYVTVPVQLTELKEEELA
jgi:hypothetical protein